MQPIRKAVFPVAGLGTRFLPATKAMPKEMLTVVDRPVIQHVVDEARDAGIEHFVFVTGRNKGVIEDHFDKQIELEGTLEARGKTAELKALEAALPGPGQTSFTRQQAPLGLGHAVWCAREIIGNEPFALLLPDMVMHDTPGCLAQMLAAYADLPQPSNLIATEQVPDEDTHQYGIVAQGAAHGAAFEITGMVEKPAPGTAPSNHIISGRYILQPQIFTLLADQAAGAGGEIQLTDAMIRLSETQPFFGYHFKGQSFDCGSKLGFLQANIALALAQPELGDVLRQDIVKMLDADTPKQ